MLRTDTSLSVQRFPFRAMGSACEVVLASSSDKDAQRLAQMAISEVIRIERKYSRYTADSVVSQVNQQAGVAPVAWRCVFAGPGPG